MPKFMFLQYVDETRAPRPGTPEMGAQIDAYAKLLEEAQAAGVMRGGDPCQPSAAVSASRSATARPRPAMVPCQRSRQG